MQRYSIRSLHLKRQSVMAVELGVETSPKLEAFENLYRRYPLVLKVIARDGEISKSLLSAFSLRRIRTWLHGVQTAYLFTSHPEVQEWTRLPAYANSDEEGFVEQLRTFAGRVVRERFEMISEHYVFNFGGPTRLMGILNATPDSFYDGGRHFDREAAVARGIEMEQEGADIIDVGGESTRPGATPISEGEELGRVAPVIERLASEIEIPISIDTYKAPVAEAAIRAGATIVNDISGLRKDANMAEVVAHYGVPVVLMHMKGEPRDMQKNPTYENLLDELYFFFEDRIADLVARGVAREKIIIDPGIGFGKRLWDNYLILQRLPEFRGLGCPILVGPSRKSFLSRVLNLPPAELSEGTAAAVAAAVAGGCQIIRVHDVKEMLRVVQIADLIFGNLDFLHEGTEK